MITNVIPHAQSIRPTFWESRFCRFALVQNVESKMVVTISRTTSANTIGYRVSTAIATALADRPATAD